jgi:hypothetical protein
VELGPGGDGIKVKELYHLPGTTLENLHGGVVLVGDKIYGGHGQGDGQPFCLDTGFPHPVIARGRLYIRVKDAALCYDLRQK